MSIRDTAERLFWTTVAGAGSAVVSAPLFDVATWKLAAAAGIAALINGVLLVARARLKVLPDPGEGLPGLPT